MLQYAPGGFITQPFQATLFQNEPFFLPFLPPRPSWCCVSTPVHQARGSSRHPGSNLQTERQVRRPLPDLNSCRPRIQAPGPGWALRTVVENPRLKGIRASLRRGRTWEFSTPALSVDG